MMNVYLTTCSKMFLLCSVFLFGGISVGIANNCIDQISATFPRISEKSNKEITSKLTELEKIMEVKITSEVRHIMGSYLERGRTSTEHILGRASIYFPIIEEYLKLYNIPNELKYLAVVESGLKPKAVSTSGAAGLWQFMPATAKLFDLRMNKYVDERLDIHRSTDAAMRYLLELYTRYDDWTLAIAAYNCGPGRVDRELKKSKRHTFSGIKKRLPKQTQRYVAKFIAVNYAIENYLFYDLHPNYPDYNIQLTSIKKVFDRQSFGQIAASTGIPLAVIRRLNPSFIQKVIPFHENGYYLTLPKIGREDNWESVKL